MGSTRLVRSITALLLCSAISCSNTPEPASTRAPIVIPTPVVDCRSNPGERLSGVDWVGRVEPAAKHACANLRMADLRGSAMPGSNFSNAVFVAANLSRSDFAASYMPGADFTDAIMTSTILTGAYLESSLFVGVDGRFSELAGATLRKARMNNANLSGSILNGANLEDAVLSDANLRGAYLAGVNFQGADLSGADLTGASLKGSLGKFIGAERARWGQTICPDATVNRGSEPCPTL